MLVALAGGLLQSSLNVAFDSTLPLTVATELLTVLNSVKMHGALPALSGAVLLEQENNELRATIKHLQKKKQQSRA
jgi:hypothetical protein